MRVRENEPNYGGNGDGNGNAVRETPFRPDRVNAAGFERGNDGPSPTDRLLEHGADLDRLVDRLYTELQRKTRVERERGGL